MRHKLSGIALTAPALMLFAFFVIAPALYALLLGFFDRHLLMPEAAAFVGIDNYVELIGSDLFHICFSNTAIFVVSVVILQGGLALLLALLIDKRLRLTSFYRSAFFSPTIMSMVVVSVLWTFLLNPSVGMINKVMVNMGIPPQGLLTDENQALWLIVLVSAWQGVGMQMMIFLAGLQDIPEQVYEAARIDGVGAFKQFTHITWPLLRNTTMFVVITTSIYAFKLFIQPFVMTQGGPNDSTRTLVMYIYEQGFISYRAGLSSAAAITFFLIVLMLSITQKKLVEEHRFYD